MALILSILSTSLTLILLVVVLLRSSSVKEYVVSRLSSDFKHTSEIQNTKTNEKIDGVNNNFKFLQDGLSFQISQMQNVVSELNKTNTEQFNLLREST